MQFKGTPREVADQLLEWAGGVGAESITVQVSWIESVIPTPEPLNRKDLFINKFDCKLCRATGYAFGKPCYRCDGKGYFEF